MVARERDALKEISKHGGKLSIMGVARELKIGNNYARIICNSLGRADYIDVSASGMCTIAPKGEEFLKKNQPKE